MDKILIIDDDIALCELLKEYLSGDGFEVTTVHDGIQALKLIQYDSFDIAILDVMLPKLNGFEVLRSIREKTDMPILMLTARGEEVDRIVGLEMGADDYLAKPCNARELSARVKAILRRANKANNPSATIIQIDDIIMNEADHSVQVDNDPIELTLTEYTMLKLLMQQVGVVVTKEALCQKALDRELEKYDRSVDVHISRLRHKLGTMADGEPRIKTIRGIGYLFRSN